jgi:nitroreductase
MLSDTENYQAPDNFSADQKTGLKKIIRERRSLYPKQFTGERIADEVVNEILDLAGTAPNHKNTVPWRFKVYSGESLDKLMDHQLAYYMENTPKEEIGENKIKGIKEKKINTSHIIAVVVHFDKRQRVPRIEEIMAVACAVQNIYLSLSSFGIAGYWSTGKIIYDSRTRDYLDLDINEELLGLFYLGVPKENIAVPKRDNNIQTIEWVR